MTDADRDQAIVATLRRRQRARVALAQQRERWDQMKKQLRSVSTCADSLTYDRSSESLLAPHWSGPPLSWPSVEEVTAVLKVMSDLEAEVGASEQHLKELDPTMLGATD